MANSTHIFTSQWFSSNAAYIYTSISIGGIMIVVALSIGLGFRLARKKPIQPTPIVDRCIDVENIYDTIEMVEMAAKEASPTPLPPPVPQKNKKMKMKMIARTWSEYELQISRALAPSPSSSEDD